MHAVSAMPVIPMSKESLALDEFLSNVNDAKCSDVLSAISPTSTFAPDVDAPDVPMWLDDDMSPTHSCIIESGAFAILDGKSMTEFIKNQKAQNDTESLDGDIEAAREGALARHFRPDLELSAGDEMLYSDIEAPVAANEMAPMPWLEEVEEVESDDDIEAAMRTVMPDAPQSTDEESDEDLEAATSTAAIALLPHLAFANLQKDDADYHYLEAALAKQARQQMLDEMFAEVWQVWKQTKPCVQPVMLDMMISEVKTIFFEMYGYNMNMEKEVSKHINQEMAQHARHMMLHEMLAECKNIYFKLPECRRQPLLGTMLIEVRTMYFQMYGHTIDLENEILPQAAWIKDYAFREAEEAEEGIVDPPGHEKWLMMAHSSV